MSTHVTLNAVVDGVEDDPDRAIVTSMLLILRNDSPASITNISFIMQYLIRMDSRSLIERRSVRSVPE